MGVYRNNARDRWICAVQAENQSVIEKRSNVYDSVIQRYRESLILRVVIEKRVNPSQLGFGDQHWPPRICNVENSEPVYVRGHKCRITLYHNIGDGRKSLELGKQLRGLRSGNVVDVKPGRTVSYI